MDTITKFEKLSLSDVNSVGESSFPELTNEEKALASQFQTLSRRLDEPQSAASLNSSLSTRTFAVGNKPSKADVLGFVSILPTARTWTSNEDISKYRHILRWADFVQNTLVNVPESDKLSVDLDAAVEREVKEKKKAKKDEKTAEKAEPAAAKDAPKDGQPKKELSEEEKKLRAEAAKAKKAAKAKANQAKQDAAKAAAGPPNPSMIDFRVGFIEKAVKHPNADSLYMSTIHMGDEEGPRTVCSGLVKYIPIEEMQQRYVIVIANLKPVTMRGVKSCAMVLCASSNDTVEFVNPPPGSKAGDKIFFEGFNGTPEKQLNPKKKIFETVQPGFTTTENFEVTWTDEGKAPVKLVNEKGELCKNTTLVNAEVK